MVSTNSSVSTVLYSLSDFILNDNALTRSTFKNLSRSDAERFLTESQFEKVILIRDSSTRKGEVVCSFKEGTKIVHILIRGSSVLTKCINENFKIVVHNKTKLKPGKIDVLKKYYFHSFDSISAESLIKEAPNGTLIFRSKDGIDDEIKRYSLTLKYEDGRVVHCRLIDNDGKPHNDEKIACIIEAFMYKYGVEQFIPCLGMFDRFYLNLNSNLSDL